jgi:alpha-glucosidase
MTNAIQWWKEAVVYQIYPRSFADANGDGIGDINGMRKQVPYLAKLGVDALWLSPHYVSPMLDAGYDVADYRDVDPIFGTLADFEALIAETHAAGMRIMCDIVPNHTSWEHAWFVEALAHPVANDPTVPAKARYADGPWARYHLLRGQADGTLPPNNWISIFGGPAWDEIKDANGNGTGWWYLHIFDKSQPDLDWDNEEVQAEFRGHLRFWFDRGVDGLRIDVAHGLAKANGYPDCPEMKDGDPSHMNPYWDQDGVHDIWRQWREVADEYDPARIFVGEIWVGPAARSARYLRSDELHTGFNFGYMTAPWEAPEIRKNIDDCLRENAVMDAPATWVLENHDCWRAVTRFAPIIGEDEKSQAESGELDLAKTVDWQSPRDLNVGRKRARAAMLTMLALPGSSYIYNGQELGLEEVFDIPGEMRQDPAFHNTNGESLGRDGCRVPLPWDTESASFGFNDNDKVWLPQPAGWKSRAASVQDADNASMLNLTRAALKLRREQPVLGGVTADVPALKWKRSRTSVLNFVRPARDGGRAIRCVMNVGDKPVRIGRNDGIILESNPGVVTKGKLAPNASVWVWA